VRRLLPTPLGSLSIFLSWLLLNQSLSAGHLVLAVLLALGLPHVYGRLAPERSRIRRYDVVFELAMVVLYDIVKSNVDVAIRILGPQSRLRPAFVWVPLDIRDPHAITALAGIITMTPGTLSSALTEDRRALLVHALDVDDEQALVEQIKQRYEAPLKEIYES
jgi:multicomponent K+:H+ antiporter subunit E